MTCMNRPGRRDGRPLPAQQQTWSSAQELCLDETTLPRFHLVPSPFFQARADLVVLSQATGEQRGLKKNLAAARCWSAAQPTQAGVGEGKPRHGR